MVDCLFLSAFFLFFWTVFHIGGCFRFYDGDMFHWFCVLLNSPERLLARSSL